MRWITREEVRVGRMGCAWLIKRFIDPEAEITTVPRDQVTSEAERTGATVFHAAGSDLVRRGELSSFEVMLERYGLAEDPTLALVGKIVGTADVPTSPWHQPEGPGLKAITEGIVRAHPTDAERLAAGDVVYDALYAYCQMMVEHGRPDGLFKQ